MTPSSHSPGDPGVVAVAARPAVRRTMNRFEVKYFVGTSRVPTLLRAMEEYLVTDPHGDPRWGYGILSVYWDTPDLALFWEKIEGFETRRKLRFRRYLDSPDVFVEVKERADRTLHKRRLRWPAGRVDEVFGSAHRGVDWAQVGDDPVAVEIALMIERLRLRPTMGISYRRQAFFGAFDPELRISLDTRLMYRPAPVDLARGFESGRYILDPRITLLEIKYDHRAPGWLTKLICRFGLKMVRMSKYCTAVDRCYFGGQNT
jgi:hypothetical protein